MSQEPPKAAEHDELSPKDENKLAEQIVTQRNDLDQSKPFSPRESAVDATGLKVQVCNTNKVTPNVMVPADMSSSSGNIESDEE